MSSSFVRDSKVLERVEGDGPMLQGKGKNIQMRIS